MDVRNYLRGLLYTFKSWSGNPPTSFLSGDGATVFWGRNEFDADGILWYRVWSIGLDGVEVDRLKYGPGVRPGAGQGVLAVDHGYLILTVYKKAGNNQPAERILVPGFQRVSAWVKPAE